jgi:5-methylcytosine-specific restriction endonuclease McrA
MEVPKGWRGRTTFYKVCQKASEDAQPFTKYGSSFRLVRTDSLGQSMEIKLGWRGRTTLDKVKHTEIVYRWVSWSKRNSAKIPRHIQMMIILLNKLNCHSLNYLEDGGSSPT